MFIIIHITATPSLKKQTSVSQHSSISQADDVSSPYSRVKNSPHDYAKVRLIFQNKPALLSFVNIQIRNSKLFI